MGTVATTLAVVGSSSVRRRRSGIVVLTALGLSFPFLPVVPLSLVGSANVGAGYALVAISLVILTGWVGQISLGHAAFVGIGAYATGWAAVAVNLPFPVGAPFAALAGAGAALVLGGVALRVRGLYLAVATLIFSWMADSYLFRQTWVAKYSTIPSRRVGEQHQLLSFDLTSRTTIFYVSWALVALAALAAVNIRDSKTGRAFFAVRGSEVAAAALGIDVTRVKLLAFGLSGALAGLAGAVVMGNGRVLSPDQFTFNVSLFFLAVAVVGGIGSLPGAIVSALLFASLTELFFRVEALGGYLDVVSATLLVVVLLVHRGGLAAMASELMVRLRSDVDRVPGPHAPVEAVAEHVDAATELEVVSSPARPEMLASVARPPLTGDRTRRREVAKAENLTVRFGGLTAVNDVSLRVHEGEIVGLIGPNGAGKTVTFNSIAGLVQPTEGTIILNGSDVTSSPVHVRARAGIARTFQLIQLFPQLSVSENLMVATHVHNTTGFLRHLLVTDRTLRAEAVARERVAEVISRMGLASVANSRVGDLPFGILRRVEVARALVTGFPFVMLDEPASGLDTRETDQLLEVFKQLNADGITLLLIEHDVKLVTSVSDYIYVLDRGQVICEGTASTVVRDQAVINAYIGQASSDAAAAGAVA
ncbi:MAG: branched-chain amino acid ABC transporter ATP-binding protein/permease [Microthrixaceae bacterium]